MAISRKIRSSGGAGDQVVLEGVPCNSLVSVGDWVRIDSSDIAQKAQADSFPNSGAVGLVLTKPTTTTADIVVEGIAVGLFSSLDPTKDYFLSPSTSGGMTVTVPNGSGEVVFKLGSPLNATDFIVQLGQRLLRA